MIPPVSPDGACLSVRRFRDRSLGLDAFASDTLVALLELLVAARSNVIVSGATSSGKTSLLNATLGCCPPGERIVTIEDTVELLPASDHLVRLEARPATPDGPAPISLEQLVRTALRLRPDRLVVGEVRGPEVLALVQALNTGHDGSWSTCHANSGLDALHRLETLVIQAAPAWPLAAVREHLTRSIDVVVHVARHHDGVAPRGRGGRGGGRSRPPRPATHRRRLSSRRAAHEVAGMSTVVLVATAAPLAVLGLALRLRGRATAPPRRPAPVAAVHDAVPEAMATAAAPPGPATGRARGGSVVRAGRRCDAGRSIADRRRHRRRRLRA